MPPTSCTAFGLRADFSLLYGMAEWFCDADQCDKTVTESGVRPATVRSSIGRSHGFLTRTTTLLELLCLPFSEGCAAYCLVLFAITFGPRPPAAREAVLGTPVVRRYH